REKLLLSASISGDYADPMFTLARIELLHAHPDCLFHLIEGLKRQAGSFRRQAILAMNLALILTASMTAALLLGLSALLFKYWKLIDHRLREAWAKKYAFPPARIVGFLVVAALAFMRLGVAAYSCILIVLLWPLIGRREKSALGLLTVMIVAMSFSAPVTKALVPAVDEESVTTRLSRINVSGANQKLIDMIGSIDDRRFSAERDFALGTLNYRLGRYTEARDLLLASVSQRDDFAPAYLNLGNVYFMQSDFNRALAGYQNVIAIDSSSALAHFNVGQAYINKMLFAESSSALKRASEHGIERYREAHPAVMLRDESVYAEGFPTEELWSMAWRESRSLESSLVDRLMRPYLLVPMNVFGIMLVVSLITGSILSRRKNAAAAVFYCDNCGAATCPDCSDDETGLHLCA
ncbi:MAG TPA: tetratricopeptide repeat protein, partial [Candidatus Krumholzibacterium sp.]|nr:tetratricopeptide repeat protein [Candidatus Krumholzibacterium sp.]